MVNAQHHQSSTETKDAQAAVFLHQREKPRYYPERMSAEIRPLNPHWTRIPDAIVVDFSSSGLGILIPGKNTLLGEGDAIELSIAYDDIETRRVLARVAHKRDFGAFSHIGATIEETDRDKTFEDIELRCIERALFM